ncbi:MAG: hypothetical protein U0350_48090 [Caldilineaceae bacterium]
MQPDVFATLLNSESTLLAAPQGYGKSTLTWAAQRQTRHEWLNVDLEEADTLDIDVMTVLLRRITAGMWNYIEQNPDALGKLQTRATAARYFLERFYDVDTDFLLACLAEDAPASADAIEAFRTLQPPELFSDTASNTQRLSILGDCIHKLGMKGIIIWIDISLEYAALSIPFWQTLQGLFDSLHVMRRRTLHIKCLAPPSVCHRLQALRGVETLSVNRLELRWLPEQLIHLIEQRLAPASDQRIAALDQLIEPKEWITFLNDFADVQNPCEWLILARLIAERVNSTGEIPLSEPAWLQVRRAYCAERVKIRLDDQGSFWRGKQLLSDLTPKKRAIYPLVKYLYDHPGVHRTYALTNALKVDETNLNTMISRARKDHLEPFLPIDGDNEEGWVYLVTDLKGGGYALQHTDRTP